MADDGYLEQARHDAADAAEREVQVRAEQMRLRDEEAVRLAKMATDHGLPPGADPAEISKLQMARWREHEQGVYDKHGCHPNIINPCDFELGTLKRVAPEVADARRARRDLRLPPQGGSL